MATSRVLRERPSLPTKGGYIALPERSIPLKLVLDKITDRVELEDEEICIKSLFDAAELARRLDFTIIGDLLRHALLARRFSKDAPAMLVHACQARPIDCEMAKHALSLFQDFMPNDGGMHRQGLRTWAGIRASPALSNLRPSFVESLGVIGALAYGQPLGACQQASPYLYLGSWDWSRVPDMFVAYVDMLESE